MNRASRGPAVERLAVLSVRHPAPGYFIARLASRVIAARAAVGQFLMLQTGPGPVPLLKRPMSVADVGLDAEGLPGSVEIAGKVVGPGTRRMHDWQPGQEVEAVGPLGTGFSLDEEDRAGRLPILLAGGVGIPPLLFVAKLFDVQGVDFQFFLGGRTAHDLLYRDRLEQYCPRLVCATDDGSVGTPGTVVDAFAPLLRERQDLICYACGPKPMLAAISRQLAGTDVPYSAAVEEVMGCGFGACLSCAVPYRDAAGTVTPARACQDGPVLDGHRIAWDAWP